MRLLFAEDERDLNRIVTQKLKKAGYSVDTCYDGLEAIDYLGSFVPVCRLSWGHPRSWLNVV